jgi:hypothetical protein
MWAYNRGKFERGSWVPPSLSPLQAAVLDAFCAEAHRVGRLTFPFSAKRIARNIGLRGPRAMPALDRAINTLIRLRMLRIVKPSRRAANGFDQPTVYAVDHKLVPDVVNKLRAAEEEYITTLLRGKAAAS